MKNWGTEKSPLVSICCPTFNHEKFIGEAIDGFLMQETDFPFEIVVRDDCSTDKTASIVKKYAEKYPKIINPIYESENQYSKGVKPLLAVLGKARGEYIATCEGDDYWLVADKVQKQIDYLLTHKDVSLVYDNGYERSGEALTKGRIFTKTDEDICDAVNGSSVYLNTAAFRNIEPQNFLSKHSYVYSGDVLLEYWAFTIGRIKKFNRYTAVYRVHSGGNWSGLSPLDRTVVSISSFYEFHKELKVLSDTEIGVIIANKILNHVRGRSGSIPDYMKLLLLAINKIGISPLSMGIYITKDIVMKVKKKILKEESVDYFDCKIIKANYPDTYK